MNIEEYKDCISSALCGAIYGASYSGDPRFYELFEKLLYVLTKSICLKNYIKNTHGRTKKILNSHARLNVLIKKMSLKKFYKINSSHLL